MTELHKSVTAKVETVTASLPGSLACRRGCTSCCVDDLTVFAVEADLIRFHHAKLLAEATPHAPGACAFLGASGDCRIYAQRPYVCRTQGLPLRWHNEDEAGNPVELRDICPLNDDLLGVPVLALAADQCWTLGEFEGALASLQAETGGNFELRRESLRELFARPGQPSPWRTISPSTE